MDIHYVSDQQSYTRMTTEELRSAFLVQNLFQTGELQLTLTDVDRAIVGSAVPTNKTLSLPTDKELGVDYFCERREVGVINIGDNGKIIVDGQTFAMGYKDSLYISKGSRSVEFISSDADKPAQFYIVSYPAHRETQTTHVPLEQANKVRLGDQEQCNKRVINQSITPGIVDSCQLVMGITELGPGSIWNTKPPHTHRRRTEVYMYFNLEGQNKVFHFMGKPNETRTLAMGNGQVALSPSWSIHSGAGTSNYAFIWAMGGENQNFDDMDHLTFDQVR